MNPKTINPKCLISRKEAARLAPYLVAFTETGDKNDEWDLFTLIEAAQNKVKRNQQVVVAFKDYKDPTKSVYARVRVTSMKYNWRSEDGPVIRITDGKASWRTDGCDCIAPIKPQA